MAQEDASRNGLRLVRAVVSKKKTRFTEQGFDLDLTYITPAVVAMGFPSSGTEAMYRNPLPEVVKFFSFFHANQYKVYNLCTEKQYPSNTFPLQSYFPHADHNPPPFKTLVAFCEDARFFTDQDPNHVLAVHCKAGKGRTGTAIAAYLCMKECATAEEAMNVFGKARTSNNKGVTIPSQQRYVMYYEAYLKNYVRSERPFDFEYPLVKLKGFLLTHCPNVDVGGGCIPYFKIFVHGEKKPKYNMRKHQKLVAWKKETQREFKFSGGDGFAVRGDFKISFFNKDTMGRTKIFHCWLNTAFLKHERYVFSKFSLDGPHHDAKHKVFHPQFSMELILSPFYGSTDESGLDENNTPFIPEKVLTTAKEESSDEEDEEEDDEEEGKRRPQSSIESYLFLKTKNKPSYKRFYFVLFASEIAYFEAMATKRPKETISLTASATMGFRTDSETEFWICPSSDGRVFDLQAKNVSLRRAWMEAIAATILGIQRSKSRTHSPASVTRRSVHDFDRNSRVHDLDRGSRAHDLDKSTRERDFDKSPRDFDKSPRDFDKSPRDFERSPRVAPERGSFNSSPLVKSTSFSGNPLAQSTNFSASPLVKSMSFAGLSDVDDDVYRLPPISPRSLAPISSSPRSLSTSSSSASSPRNLAAPESKSLSALRTMIQNKQQALAAKPVEVKIDQAAQSDVPVISLTPSEPSSDSDVTLTDSQVMEKLRQIQKLLAVTASTPQTDREHDAYDS